MNVVVGFHSDNLRNIMKGCILGGNKQNTIMTKNLKEKKMTFEENWNEVFMSLKLCVPFGIITPLQHKIVKVIVCSIEEEYG